MHGVHDVQLRAALVCPLLFYQCLWNNAHDTGAALQCGIGNDAHQATFATAVDELAAMRTNPMADLRRRCSVGRV
jgi:hypothetical protein